MKSQTAIFLCHFQSIPHLAYKSLGSSSGSFSGLLYISTVTFLYLQQMQFTPICNPINKTTRRSKNFFSFFVICYTNLLKVCYTCLVLGEDLWEILKR
jgi:hypothetical protein